jgi:ABC-type microcin C transport system duplicated ATPase subunit YejF
MQPGKQQLCQFRSLGDQRLMNGDDLGLTYLFIAHDLAAVAHMSVWWMTLSIR